MSVLLQSDLPLPLFQRGKVRDIYNLGNALLIVSTDRISAFDRILPCGIPDKGNVLNQISSFWFGKTAHIIANHLIKAIDSHAALDEVKNLAKCPEELPEYLIGRSMIVAKAERIPVECVARGYLSGSAWIEYKENGAVSSIRLPGGMQEGQKLTQPIFTPTTKSETGHDYPLNSNDIEGLCLKKLMPELEKITLHIYQYAQSYAKDRGIIIAETKLEFGFINGKLTLIDELLTPDSSRFWDASQYEAGHAQPSFDKQIVRDWLLSYGWNKEPPAPMLPPEVIEFTAQRYREIHQLFAGKGI